ncbi:MAG: hypothetical protein Ct9H300mP28_10550 [Pseudomonadota bacterium]|nr:MAG: hypothetical protein Ct9H300mP28_10550 [Pseudomonadota bacterium]
MIILVIILGTYNHNKTVRINRIRVSGFKSFCHPVNLQFKQNGITIIVGPKGVWEKQCC